LRIFPRTRNACFFHRPFEGNTIGAALYASAPGSSTVVYRNRRVFGRRGSFVGIGSAFPLGAAHVQKTAALAFATSPTNSFSFVPPASWDSQTVLLNIRTHECDCENETIAGYRKFSFNGSGQINTGILGTATLTVSQNRDGGGWLFSFVYIPSSDGTQPTQFNLIRTAGPSSPATVSANYVAGQRTFSLAVAGLTNAGAYTFKIQAQNGATTKDLLTGLAITADSAGPPAVSGLTAVEY
jgi:hypothetical protein